MQKMPLSPTPFNHASIIELEARLKEARERGARHVLIATDGVFSMDGVIANLKGACVTGG